MVSGSVLLRNPRFVYGDLLKNGILQLNCKFRYLTFQRANNIGADQNAHMRKLVCAFIGRIHQKSGFLATVPNKCQGLPY